MSHIQLVAGNEESADAEQVRNGLYSFNMTTTVHPHYDPVAFFLKDGDGQVLGGILGYEWGGWLHITHLWVSDLLRGKGFGKRLLMAAEEHAIDNGCHQSLLETFSFQARPFYERFGYDVAAQIDGYPEGYACYFMRKALTAPLGIR